MAKSSTSFKKGNIFSIGNNGGKPPVFKTAQDLEDTISEYFDGKGPQYDDDGEFTHYDCPTVTGLALYLGFCSRQSLFDYGQKAEYSYIIQRARACIENHYENSLNGKSSTGAIFALKNMGWADRTEITHNDKRDQAQHSKLIMEALKNKSRNK